MSYDSQAPAASIKHAVMLDILATAITGFIGLSLLEASNKSLILGPVIDVGGRLPVPLVVYTGSLLLGVAFYCIDRSHPFSHWYLANCNEVDRSVFIRHKRIVTLVCSALVFVMILFSFGAPIDRVVLDYFHEGEILAGLTILEQGVDVPILIHGPGRNLLPGALALQFAESGQEIVFMRFITGIGAMVTLSMVAMAAYVFAFGMLEGLSSGSQRNVISAIVCLFATLFAFTSAHITNRHVFFLLALAVAAAIIHAAGKENQSRLPLAALFGAVCALAPIYVYSSGLGTLALAAIVTAILLLFFRRQACRILVVGGVFFAASVIVVILLGGGELYINAFRDISWWAFEAGGIWSTPINSAKAIIQALVLVGTMAGLGYLAVSLVRSDELLDRRKAGLVFLIFFAVAIAARDMLDRSDAAHTGFSMLTVAIGMGALSSPLLMRLVPLIQKGRIISLAILSSIGIALTFSAGGPQQFYRAFAYAGAPEFGKLGTSDFEILPREIIEVSEWYDSDITSADCLLALTNEGVLNYALDLPPCGDFFYPIYASVQPGDRRLADWILTHHQFIAVVETDFWSGSIDGKPMKNRLPKVWEIMERKGAARKEVNGRTFAIF